jgi:hypothetical protein
MRTVRAEECADGRPHNRTRCTRQKAAIRFRSRRDRLGVSPREGGDELYSHAGRTDQAVRVFLASDVTCYDQASRAQPGTADERSAVHSSRMRVALIAGQEDYPEAQTMPVLRASSTLSVIPGTGYHTHRARR